MLRKYELEMEHNKEILRQKKEKEAHVAVEQETRRRQEESVVSGISFEVKKQEQLNKLEKELEELAKADAAAAQAPPAPAAAGPRKDNRGRILPSIAVQAPRIQDVLGPPPPVSDQEGYKSYMIRKYELETQQNAAILRQKRDAERNNPSMAAPSSSSAANNNNYSNNSKGKQKEGEQPTSNGAAASNKPSTSVKEGNGCCSLQ